MRTATFTAAAWALSAWANGAVLAQASSRPCSAATQRSDDPHPACVTSAATLGALPPSPMFWHLDTYATREAAAAAESSRGAVVESLGRIWLFTIAERDWRPSAGNHVATIGPLPLAPGAEYTAVYMQSIFEPGTTAALHQHSGPEAFYTLTGESCVETPSGVVTGDTGGRVLIVGADQPMMLTASGAARRRAIALILHDSSRPATTMTHDWTPKGLCK